MSFNHTLSAVLRGRWLIDRSWAEAHLPLVLSLLQGKNIGFIERTGDKQFESPYAIDPKTMNRYEWKNGSNANIPAGSVGVIPINGAITKYDGFCGEPGAISHATVLSQMKKREAIGSAVIHTDTPGGEVSAGNTFDQAIKSFGKPLLAFVNGMSASMGVRMMVNADEIYASNKTDEIGSVGAIATVMDFKGALEKEGIKLHEIYAPQSTDKNKEYRNALNGDYTAIEKELEGIVNDFISVVKMNRPAAAATESEWSTGKMFNANEAQRLGLIDGIKSFDQVISKASWLSKRKKY